jgi:heme ABC exporter ATP-binding subunit CcmA
VSAPAILAEGLDKRFGPVTALRGLDLAVPVGSLLAVLGPNGAGKSTLLRLLAGLARPSRGRLRVGPEERGGDRRRARRHVGYLGHASLLYPELTARENLLFAARLYGVSDRERVATDLLDQHDLGDLAERRASTLSQGQARRLAIARCLVHDPPVVLLDEPFAGLDRAAAGRLAERLARLKADGRTAVLVTHDLARAAELADAGLVLVEGRAVRRAEPAELASGALEGIYLEALAEAGAA